MIDDGSRRETDSRKCQSPEVSFCVIELDPINLCQHQYWKGGDVPRSGTIVG